MLRPLDIEKLSKILPSDRILLSQEELLPYGTDWTRAPGKPSIVFFPKTTEEVSKILRHCSEHRLPVVPSGGRTGLAGGASTPKGEIVLSLEKMNRIQSFDPLGLTLTVQAGVTTQAVHEYCAPHHITWPIDLASKGTSQIGGNLSTNAGGIRVIRYGMARKWVMGLEAVTITGEILRLNRGLEKNNTGYDLLQLLLGSEGTLAVITEATLKLTRIPTQTKVFLLPAQNLEICFKILEKARKGPFDIIAFEFFSKKCLEAVETHLGRRSRLKERTPFYTLIEVDEKGVSTDPWVDSLFEEEIVSDGFVSQSSDERKEIWGLREGITESLSRMGRVTKYDVSVSVDKLPAFLPEMEEYFQKTEAVELFLFGHLGDGSPHLNLVKKPTSSDATYQAECTAFEPYLYERLKYYGGSVSSEHGVGILKTNWVRYSRSPEELRIFREIKRIFDPNHLLNPGKVVPE